MKDCYDSFQKKIRKLPSKGKTKIIIILKKNITREGLEPTTSFQSSTAWC